MAVLEEAAHPKIYYVNERPGLKRSIGSWLRTILETVSAGRVVLRESNWDLVEPSFAQGCCQGGSRRSRF